MSQIGPENPAPIRRGREAEMAAQTVDACKRPGAAIDSIGGNIVPTTQPFGPGDWLFAAALSVVVFLVYQPAWHGGFVWDDDLHLLNNPVLKPGGLAKVWVPGGYLNYWPLTFTAYWLQFKLWGLNPLGFHLVNIALHAISALLVWRILVQLRIPGGRFAAALFALHPVNVESVAWIAQLKNVLSLLLALVSIYFFLTQDRRGGWWRLDLVLVAFWRSDLALVAFWLSTLAKGLTITLPVVLLACAWWQRGRIERRDLLRVVPYLLIGALMAGMEVWTQHLEAVDTVVRADSFLSRTAVAACSVWFYLGKLIWPVNLCFIYPRWRIDDPNVLSFLPGLLLVMLLAVAGWRRRGWGRPVVMLLVCYVGLLLPELGFVNIYFMLYSLVADHWQYAAMIVPCTVVAGAAATLARGRLGGPRIGYVLCGALLATMAILTWRQSRMYADVETLYRTTIDTNPACWLVHNNLGNTLLGRGEVGEAIAQYRKALEIKPDYALAHNNLGNALTGRGQFEEAIAHCRKALEIKPDYAEAHINLGIALALSGQLDTAIAHFQKALEIEPDHAEAHNNLGLALAGRGRVDEAIAHYRKALQNKPGYAEAHYNLGVALAGRGQLEEAIAQYRKALEIKPGYAESHYSLGNALADRGQVDEAMAQYGKALEIKPGYAEVHINLGNALAGRGQVDEAITHYRKALEIKPDYAEAHINLGIALAGRGQFDEAITHYRKALEIMPDSAEVHYNLGVALAGRGQFDEAIVQYQKALDIKPDDAEAHNNLGVALVSRGRFDEAIAHFRKALEIKPDYADARRNLEIARSKRP